MIRAAVAHKMGNRSLNHVFSLVDVSLRINHCDNNSQTQPAVQKTMTAQIMPLQRSEC